MPHRHEIGLTGRVLLLQQGNRVRTVSGRAPNPHGRRVCLLARFLSERPAFLDTQVLNLAPLHGLTLPFVLDLLARIGEQGRDSRNVPAVADKDAFDQQVARRLSQFLGGAPSARSYRPN